MSKQIEAIESLLAEYDMVNSSFAKDLREALAEQPAQSTAEKSEQMPSVMAGFPVVLDSSMPPSTMKFVQREPRAKYCRECLTYNGHHEGCSHYISPLAQRDGLEMVNDEGENQAVRMFLVLYGGQHGITAEQMRKHLNMTGFDGAWPEWASAYNGHLTRAGAQLWIRHLLSLEQPAQPAPAHPDDAAENIRGQS